MTPDDIARRMADEIALRICAARCREAAEKFEQLADAVAGIDTPHRPTDIEWQDLGRPLETGDVKTGDLTLRH